MSVLNWFFTVTEDDSTVVIYSTCSARDQRGGEKSTHFYHTNPTQPTLRSPYSVSLAFQSCRASMISFYTAILILYPLGTFGNVRHAVLTAYK